MLIVQQLSKFIKYNKNLLHLDLSSTGLTENMLWQLGTALRRAKSLLAIHLSDNPGVTKVAKEYLFSRIRCKPLEQAVHLDF